MKKKMIALVAGALMTLAASSAFASFGDLDLIRVVYQRSGGTVEIASELGDVRNLTATQNNTVGDALSADQLGLTNAYIAYIATNRATKELWITGSDETKIGSLKTATIEGIFAALYNTYNGLGGTAGATTVVGSTTLPNSYMVKAGSTGSMKGAITGGFNDTEASLANLANGAITQNLYYFNSYATGKVATALLNEDGTNVRLTLNTDGTTTINNSIPTANTPLPAAAYLLGSGLLGLVGVRRKMNKA